MITRRYNEIARLDSFEERFEYLKLRGAVGKSTFGFDRWINQGFYQSAEWKSVRHAVIVRDNACDLGVRGFEIGDRIIIHHMNPMTPDAIENGDADIVNPDFLISVTHKTHNAIHYGDSSLLALPLKPRERGDTKLW